jgi:cysteine-rich repeat protein
MRVRFDRGGSKLVAGAAIAAAVLVAASFTFGAASAPGTITACYKAKGGAVRIVDATERCRAGERETTWRKVGPVGATGLTGAKGVAGGQGAAGAAGTTGAAGADGAQGAAGAKGDPGVSAFGDLSGLKCARGGNQTGTIQIAWGTGNVARLRCVLPGDGPVCGDGVTEGGEACDDGNGDPTDSCTNQCHTPSCGDNVVQSGEECDSGGVNSTTCDANCTTAYCGDGTTNADRGEACDPGGPNSTATCNLNCTVTICGDGLANPAAGEQCDDGNVVNGDGCTSSCQYG